MIDKQTKNAYQKLLKTSRRLSDVLDNHWSENKEYYDKLDENQFSDIDEYSEAHNEWKACIGELNRLTVGGE